MSNTPKTPAKRAAQKADSDARKAEATGVLDKIEVDYDGQTYVIEREAAEDVELYELVEDEKYVTAIRGFLGTEQWDRFKDAHRSPSGRVPFAEFEKFLNTMMEAVGAGNGSAPSTT